MAEVAAVPPVKLFVITLHHDSTAVDSAMKVLEQEWGAVDYVSKEFPFEVTDYYQSEMGADLKRQFYSFEKLIDPEMIVAAKLRTNMLELDYAKQERRTINLDPGYLDYYKVVLASAKYGGQKIYIGSGIYADMTLVMYKAKWESFAWSFPDFKSGLYDSTLSLIRDRYKQQIKNR